MYKYKIDENSEVQQVHVDYSFLKTWAKGFRLNTPAREGIGRNIASFFIFRNPFVDKNGSADPELAARWLQHCFENKRWLQKYLVDALNGLSSMRQMEDLQKKIREIPVGTSQGTDACLLLPAGYKYATTQDGQIHCLLVKPKNIDLENLGSGHFGHVTTVMAVAAKGKVSERHLEKPLALKRIDLTTGQLKIKDLKTECAMGMMIKSDSHQYIGLLV